MGKRRNKKVGGFGGSRGQPQPQQQSQHGYIGTGGFINPALLAQHAALAASSSSSPSYVAASTAMKKKKESNHSNKTKKRQHDDNHDSRNKKRKKEKDENSNKTFTSKQQQKDSFNNEDTTLKQKYNNKATNNECTTTNATKVASSLYTFDHVRWRRVEQLCYTLLFPLFSQTTNNKTRRDDVFPKIVFVSSSSKAKHFAALFKPMMVYPNFSFACHTKVKRNQLREVVARIVFCNNDGDTATLDDSNNNSDRSVLFVHDKSIPLLQSVCNEVDASRSPRKKQQKKKNKKNKHTNIVDDDDESGKNKTESLEVKQEQESHIIATMRNVAIRNAIAGVYYDHPKSLVLVHQRRKVIQSFAKLISSASSSMMKAVELILDGTLDKKIDFTKDDNDKDDNFPSDYYNDCNRQSENMYTASNNDEEDENTTTSPSSLQKMISSSNRPITQALVNSSEKYTTTPDKSSQRAKMALDRLKVNLAVLNVRSRLASSSSLLLGEDTNTIMNKMKILGMICDTSVSGGNSKREAALTQWLDGATAQKFGGAWNGRIRQGASGEEASRKLATLLHKSRMGVQTKGNAQPTPTELVCFDCNADSKDICWSALSKWSSNPAKGDNINTTIKRGFDDADEEDGEIGISRDFGHVPHAKACGHNETTMFFLRPFAALEVLNSRVCSKSSPAPGNAGFEGCLEFLQRICAAEGKSMTFWDSECFAFINGKIKECQDGKLALAPVFRLMKEDLLPLPCEKLVWLMNVMRQWTIYREISMGNGCHPRKMLEGIGLTIGLLQNTTTSKKLTSCKAASFLPDLAPKLTYHILSYIFPGSVAEWKSIGSVSC
mmetsp:Transcript_15000/g.22205  ORF Transcript_15000/g.22205 Transcript_15000/m.22205 type:complete len:832 (-) Transcript_15000:3618-6113(-)